MKYPATIVPVLLPHESCPTGCPYCPRSASQSSFPTPGPEDVDEAVSRALRNTNSPDRPLELAFYGGDLWSLERGPRTALLDAAEREVRQGRVCSIRLTLSAEAVLKAPLAELRARGVGTVEVPLFSLDVGVRSVLGLNTVSPQASLEGLGRLHRARLRSIAHLSPGLPGSSHETAVASASTLAAQGPGGVRILPALALEGTRLLDFLEDGWVPMRRPEAIVTCKETLLIFRAAGVPVIRVGWQPGLDFAESPDVVQGPFDPSLRAEVESEALRQQVIDALTSVFALGTRAFTVVIHPRQEHGVRGPENRLLRELRQQFRLEELRILGVEEQPPGTIRAFQGLLTPDDVPPLPRGSAKKAS